MKGLDTEITFNSIINATISTQTVKFRRFGFLDSLWSN